MRQTMRFTQIFCARIEKHLKDLSSVCKFMWYVGAAFALAIFAALMVMIWTKHDGQNITFRTVEAFIIAATIIVVATPEGLPLAKTIALSYSVRRMWEDNNLIRVLSACETIGNATTICSDKTGVLTENVMAVTEGWFAGVILEGREALSGAGGIEQGAKQVIMDNIITNNSASILRQERQGRELPKPIVSGSAIEGALLMMVEEWGVSLHGRKDEIFDTERDYAFPFNSSKKRSCSVVHKDDGRVHVYVKGASERVLAECTHYSNSNGVKSTLDEEFRQQLGDRLFRMADKGLHTLCVAHRVFDSISEMPKGWESGNTTLDSEELVLDCLVGIHFPLRPDVKEAVKIAQRAGVVVRMITGDNMATARAIARKCGILQEDGFLMEGPDFRKLTLQQVDKILPKLQVLARATPTDKVLLVSRLNGQNLPKNKEEWEKEHEGSSWETERDLLLPGYKEEWEATRSEGGGHVVAVTGDGANDAPALKAADVGFSMGIAGSEVAKEASDIIILNDKFSSILKAIVWGRSVNDNIRKFLQFQLTVNMVALFLVFIGAVTGVGSSLKAVLMLWVMNFIMNLMGALALGADKPTPALLARRPYKRGASLVSRPMWRNILSQSAFQLVLLFGLLYSGHSLFNTKPGDHTHFTIIFTVFVFCQVFNAFNARSTGNDCNVFKGLPLCLFIGTIIVTIFVKVLIVECSGLLLGTGHLTASQWFSCLGLGALVLPVGFLMRFIPVKEDESTFFESSEIISTSARKTITKDNQEGQREASLSIV